MYILRSASSCHAILFAVLGRQILVTFAVAPEIISHGNAPYKTVRQPEIVTIGNSVNTTCSYPQLPVPGGKKNTLVCICSEEHHHGEGCWWHVQLGAPLGVSIKQLFLPQNMNVSCRHAGHGPTGRRAAGFCRPVQGTSMHFLFRHRSSSSTSAHGHSQETGPGEIQGPGQKGLELLVCFLDALSQDAFIAETPNNKGVLFCQPEKIHNVRTRLHVLHHNCGF